MFVADDVGDVGDAYQWVVICRCCDYYDERRLALVSTVRYQRKERFTQRHGAFEKRVGRPRRYLYALSLTKPLQQPYIGAGSRGLLRRA